MRVLVCGSRGFKDIELMGKFFHQFFDRDDTITLIHGDAEGADQMAEDVLEAMFKGGFRVERYPAEWDKYGKAAGPIRNQQMLDEGRPDMVIAFPGGKGTAHMVAIALEAGIPVQEIHYE